MTDKRRGGIAGRALAVLLVVAPLAPAAPIVGDERGTMDDEPMTADDGRIAVDDELAPLMRELLGAIEAASGYDARAPLPHVYLLPQPALEAKVCDEPCSVLAAYVPYDGIYLAANMDPLRELSDRAALLHELVHHLQQDHAKFAALAPCQREREKEREAFALQNAYLRANGETRAVAFNDDFDCEATPAGD